MRVSLALWPRQAQPRMGRWSIARPERSRRTTALRSRGSGSHAPTSPRSGTAEPRRWPRALPPRSGLGCAWGMPPGSQSLAGGYIPSPHAGLSMGPTDRGRLQMCHCTPELARLRGALQGACSGEGAAALVAWVVPTVLLYAASRFLVGTYNTLCQGIWGTSPPDPLGFTALEARAAPSKDRGDDRFGRIVPAALPPLRRSGRFPPEPYLPQRQGDCSTSCPRRKAINPGGLGAKPPRPRPHRRRAHTGHDCGTQHVGATHKEP